MDELKIGARNSSKDAERLQQIHDLAAENGAACAKSMEDELINFGSEIKALGQGKVGGYLIRYSTKDDPDLTNDFFTKDTNFNIPESLPVLYNHGLDKTIKKRIIGKAVVTFDEVGAWAESQLNMRDKYEEEIYALVEAGKLGYSSGALAHLVEREPASKGVSWIKSWFVGEVSLTPTPAEPRNSIVTLKSLIPSEQAALPITEDTKTIEVKNIQGENKMEDVIATVDVKALIAAALKEQKDAEDAKQANLKAIADAKAEGAKEAVEELKAKKLLVSSQYHTTDKVNDDNDGMQAFKAWMGHGDVNHGLIEPDSVFQSIKGAGTAFNITTGGSGAYLVPDPLYAQIIAKRSLVSWIRQAPCPVFQTSADHVLVPYEDTAHTALVSTGEGVAYDENEGTVGQKDLSLTKYTKLIKASEEFLSDTNSNWEAWLASVIGRTEAMVENTVATANVLDGSGATAATAAATSTAITAAELARLIGSLGAGYNVQGECGFLTKNVTKWYLKGLSTSYNFAFNTTPTTPDFFGYPGYISDDMPAMTTGLYSTVFGNWTFFGIAEKQGIVVSRNPWLYQATGQVGIFVNKYFACDVLQSEAIYKMAQA